MTKFWFYGLASKMNLIFSPSIMNMSVIKQGLVLLVSHVESLPV